MSPGKTGDTDRRRNGGTASGPASRGEPAATLHVTLPALPVSDSLVRDRVRQWLLALRWPQGQLGDVLLAASEAVSNAIEHAYRSRVPGLVEVKGRLHTDSGGGRRVELTVRDFGSWRQVPTHNENRRRGIPLMRACMDDVSIEGTEHGTEIRMRSRTVPPPIGDRHAFDV